MFRRVADFQKAWEQERDGTLKILRGLTDASLDRALRFLADEKSGLSETARLSLLGTLIKSLADRGDSLLAFACQ